MKPEQIGHAYRAFCGLRVMVFRYPSYLNGGSLETLQTVQRLSQCGPGPAALVSPRGLSH